MIVRLQCAMLADTAFPRDRMVINPTFEMTGALHDPQQLATDLATALDSYWTSIGEIIVKAYDVEGTKPVYPSGSSTKNASAMRNSTLPRELACCLSFYAGQNVPRRRGRLFLPISLVTGAAVTLRPSTAVRTKVSELVPILAGLGGVDVDWVVYSQRDHAAHKVTNWWVDDEWDVQRSRGLRATTRLTGTTSG